MTARNPDGTRPAVSLRLPADLLELLDREADARVLGRTKLVELLLRDALGRLPDVTLAPAPEIVHRSPRVGEDVSPCCGRSPFEMPDGHRLTNRPELVTCGRPDNPTGD